MGSFNSKEQLNRAYIVDKKSKKKFYIEETVKTSMVPKKWNRKLFVALNANNIIYYNKSLKVYGCDIRKVDFGLRQKKIHWSFAVTDCQNAVIGIDFLKTFPELRQLMEKKYEQIPRLEFDHIEHAEDPE